MLGFSFFVVVVVVVVVVRENAVRSCVFSLISGIWHTAAYPSASEGHNLPLHSVRIMLPSCRCHFFTSLRCCDGIHLLRLLYNACKAFRIEGIQCLQVVNKGNINKVFLMENYSAAVRVFSFRYMLLHRRKKCTKEASTETCFLRYCFQADCFRRRP